MKIRSLRLRNFQSFEDLYLELDPHLNCIVGPSNVGKSAIIRALDFLFYDEWDSSYVKDGASFASVEVVLEDGTVIQREKGLSVNRVKIRYPDGSQRIFENFGSELPKEVKLVLGNASLEIEGVYTKVNVSNQEDPHFLIGYSPQLRSRLTCYVSGLDILEGALSLSSDEKNSLSKKLRELNEKLSELRLQLVEIGDLSSKREEVQRKECLLENVKEKYRVLSNLLQIREKIALLKHRIKSLKEKDYTSIDYIEKKLNDYEKLLNFYNKLKSLFQRKLELEKEKSDREEKLLLKKREYEKALREYKLCPVCNSPLDEQKILELVSSIV